jgi:ribosomal protein S18 acetylase RimI-like enzyme
MEGLPIRNARRGDIPSLVLLGNALLEETARRDPRLAPHPRAREHLAARFAEWIADPDHVIAVAEEGGRLVVGFATGHVEPGFTWQGARRVGRIADCYVVPPRRRRGIARRLVSRVTDALEQAGAEAVRLCTPALGDETQAFWRAAGFDPLDVVLERDAPGSA